MTGARWTALLWLDWRLLVNRIRSIRRNPRRLIPWAVFLLWIVPSFLTRLSVGTHLRRDPAFASLDTVAAPLGALVPGVALCAIGIAVWRAASSAPAAFQSPADARFVIGAGLDSRAVFTWLSLRTARQLIITFVLMLVLLQVLYLPWLGFSFASGLAFTFAVATFFGIVFGARLLAFSLQRATPAIPIGMLGLLVGAAGAAAFLVSLAHITGAFGVPDSLAIADAELPPGSWMVDAFRGSLSADVLLLAVAVGLTAGGIALAGDCYPELWAASSRLIAIRRAMRTRGGAFAYLSAAGKESRRPERHVVSESGARVPGGALAVIWKEWLAIKRARGGLQLQGALVVGAVALGLLVGVAVSRGSRIAGVVGALVVVLVIFWSWAAGIQLARDLGNPLWWLSSAVLWSRLAVWTFARGLRFAVPLIVFAECVIAGSGSGYLWAIPLAPILPLLLCWMSQAVGLGVYTLLPARTDYRLAVTLRMMAIYAIIVPLGLSTAPGLILRSPALVVTLPAIVVGAVIVGMIAFANWRIQGNALVFAHEERQ